MEITGSDGNIVRCIRDYLFMKGEGPMLVIAQKHAYQGAWVSHHNKLRWDSLLEGRVSKLFFIKQAAYLKARNSRIQITSWAVGFITRLLNVTHQQWLYWNMRLHIQLTEGKTESEHHNIMEQVQEMLDIDDRDLLPQHQELLQCDFTALRAGSTADCQYWLVSMESALQAAKAGRTES
jgi:hypothetical protein